MGFRLSRSLFQTLLLFTIELWPSGGLFHKLFPPFLRWNSGYREAFLTNFFFFHDGILAIKEPFSRTFLFSRRNSGYQGAFHTNFSFLMMEFWLSRSLSHELFFFHDGILANKEPFTRIFLFSRWNSGYQGAFHTNFYFFTMEFWLSRSLSHELFFFHDGILKIRVLGEGSFHIYHKEYLHRIRLVKNLAS
jgi:hypothetical protein